jgi:hypothetical protein
MIDVDAPGSTSANLRSLRHTHCPRPMFPLDDNVSFEPRVELYTRPRDGHRCRERGASVNLTIREIVAVGLHGATPAGGWSAELRPDDSVHTLVAVVTEEGPVGYGSAFTNVALVRAALAQLEPLYRGASAVEPERTSEILHQNTFWLAAGR